jgi:hypothetical protein
MDPHREKRIRNALRSIKRKEAKTLPIHMIKRDTHDLLKKNIDNNNLINEILKKLDFDSIYEELMIQINSLIPSTMRYNYCIGGSKAWYNIFKDYYDRNLLSEYEKSAIHNFNTCDHHYFINNNDEIFMSEFEKNVLTLLGNLSYNINDVLNKIVKNHFKDENKQAQLVASVSNRASDKLLFIDDNTKIIEFSLIISDIVPKLKSQQQPQQQSQQLPQPLYQSSQIPQMPKQSKPRASRKTTTQIAAEIESEKKQQEQVKMAAASSRASRAAARAESRGLGPVKKGGSNGDIIRKKILSFEINYRDVEDTFIRKIDSLIMENHFLNVYGLFIILKIAKIRFYIPREKYNIFKIREHIYNKLVLIDEYKTDALFTILDIYNKTFKDYNIPKDFLYQELNKLALTSNPKINDFINNTEAAINELFRPYINRTIYDINEEIKTLKFTDNFGTEKDGKDYSGIFVVGGDAIRRYDYNGSITKDIDAKIYIPDELNIDSNIYNYNKINKCIYDNLFKLVGYLISNQDFFSNVPLHQLERTFSPTENNKYKCKVSFVLKSADDDFLNFRFRQIPKNLYPVDLYSLDYRCVINFDYKLASGEIINYKHYHDIAFIDIAMEKSQNNNYDKFAVISNHLPVASLDFLIYDLINTYNTDTSSLIRFINGKNNKDYERFKSLTAIVKKNNIFTIDPETKIIEYKKSITRQNTLQLDIIKDFEMNSSTYKRFVDYMKLFYKLYNFYNQDTSTRVKRRIIYDFKKSVLLQTTSSIKGGGSRRGRKIDSQLDIDYYDKIYNNITDENEVNEINKIIEPTKDDDYISNIMNPIYELEPDEEQELFKKLISNI